MSVAILISLAIGAIAFALAGAVMSTPELLVIAYSLFAAVPTSAAAVASYRKDVFSPMNVLNYVTLLSLPVFCLYIYFIADEEKSYRKMYGLEMTDLYPGITLVIFGLIFLIFGYFLAGANPKRVIASQVPVRGRKLLTRFAIVMAVILATIAAFFYARDVGLGEALEDGGNLVAKRVHEGTQGVAPRGSALTHWRLIGYTLPHALLIVTLALMWTGQLRRTRFDTFLLAALLVISLFIPFIAGSRAPIFEIALILLVIVHYTRKRFSFRKMALLGVAGLFALGVLGQMRQASFEPGETGLARTLGVFEEIIGASYFMDASKNAIIVREVPENVDYLYGSSLVTIVPAVIPRQLWPEKPIIRVGFFVGQEVIGLNNQTGIPPGFIAELYLNFGYWLIPFFMILVGVVLRKSYDAAILRKTSMSVITYAVLLKIILLSLLPTDLTYALFQILTLLLPIYVIHQLLLPRPAFQRHASAS